MIYQGKDQHWARLKLWIMMHLWTMLWLCRSVKQRCTGGSRHYPYKNSINRDKGNGKVRSVPARSKRNLWMSTCCTNYQIYPLANYVRLIGFLIRSAQVDRALCKYVPAALQTCIVYLSHYLTSAIHRKERRMYVTMMHPFLSLHIAKSRTHNSEGLSLMRPEWIPIEA